MYKTWGQALGRKTFYSPDHFTNVYRIIETWFHCNLHTGRFLSIPLIAITSLLILALPLLRISKYKNQSFRLMFLASLLIWATIFNPKAESPTYIIAMTGVAIWFIAQRMTPYTIVLLAIAIIFTSLSSTDLFPGAIKDYLGHFHIKAVPCLIIWIAAQIQLLSMRFKNQPLTILQTENSNN